MSGIETVLLKVFFGFSIGILILGIIGCFCMMIYNLTDRRPVDPRFPG